MGKQYPNKTKLTNSCCKN